MHESSASHEITHLFESLREGDPRALDDLFERVYEELRAMARKRLRAQGSGQTLQTTELVHEAYFKLVANQGIRPENRRHFFGAAVRAMRQILIDRARERAAEKRGGGRARITLDQHFAAAERPADLLELDRALERFAREFPRPARTVQHRYFLGLTIQEVAEILEVSPRTVNADWSFAKAWLKRELSVVAG
ncbi:MAG: sigma-70 family RNA polymerase sigma factor [Holophagales bacterium]|nr:sigma-70 family RNA polymerase sigma factor [Holophagales bacterium]